jgi:predicted metal-dependent HD superfamily phosphohydrolase
MFNKAFIHTVQNYNDNGLKAEKLWYDIEQQYTKKNRHYHNLNHLTSLFGQLDKIKEEIRDWDTIIFSIAYHDIIYNVRKNDNEEQSAIYSEKVLHSISYPDDKILKCKEQILATKTHKEGHESDTDFFTDADLSILGADTETYLKYVEQIRKEYKIYPDILYKPGRAKVLKHFLDMDRIFKTDHFYALYEHQARKNLLMELNLYS